MDLKTELNYFASIKDELVKNYDGKFALVKGERFYNAFDTLENAYNAGVGLFGQDLFLVKRVSAQSEVCRNQALSLGILNAHL